MRWLLQFLKDDADRRAIESERAELYEMRRRQEGQRAADRWLRRQRLLYPLYLVSEWPRASVVACLASGPRIWRDIVHGTRSLARAPGLVATIILTVGVALGVTTVTVAIVRAVLVKPLPYESSDELFWIYTDSPPYRWRLSLVDYRALEADHPAFREIAAYQTNTVTVLERDAATRVMIKSVTGSYFPVLRQRPVIGRLFDASDDRHGDAIAVLTASYWRTQFGADPAVLGRGISLDGTTHTIVGVLEHSVGPLERDVALFTAARWAAPKRKGPFFFMVLGRLRHDVSRAAAVDTLRATNARLFPLWKASYQDEKATWGMLDLKTRAIGNIRTPLLLVLAAVGCVLLIACVNAVNLLIARAITRSRELAIRSALGASRGQLLQHLVIETGLLMAAAAAIAGAVTLLILKLVTTYGAAYLPRIEEVRLSGSLLGWLTTLGMGSGIVMFLGGAVPALHGSRARPDRMLRSAGRTFTGGRSTQRLRRALVAVEFALATPLVVAAVLVVTSLERLRQVDVGIDTDRLLTAAVSLTGPNYARDADRAAFWVRALDRFAALPTVDAAAIADGRPPRETGMNNNFELEDRPTPPGQNQPVCPWVAVSPSFFKTVGLRLERGRLLDEYSPRDDVIVVDRAWANRFFPGENVLGRRLRGGGCATCPWTTVVGVVENAKWSGLETSGDGTVYWPFVDLPNGYVHLRTATDPAASSRILRQALRELDPTLPLTRVATGDELVAESLTTPRYLTVLVGLFALAALVLSAVGIYGVMAYFVQQHARDIGIRLALGGEPSIVRRMVVLQGLRYVVAGIAAGVVAALATSRFLTTVLFEVNPTDLWTMAGVPAALLAIATLGCAVPGHRAARLAPADVLRE